MLKQVFVSLLVLHSCFCIAQLRKDSLLNSIYLKSTVDTSKVNSYCLLVPTYLNDGMPDSALECANNALALSTVDFK